MVEKCDFYESTQNSIPGKSIFGQFEVSFLNVYFFSRAGWFFSVITFEEKHFNEKMSSLAGLKKKLFIFLQKNRFWPFLTTWVHIQSRFSQRTRKFSKNPCSVSWGRLLETLCWIFSFLSSKRCGRVAVLQVNIFRNPCFQLLVILWRGHL